MSQNTSEKAVGTFTVTAKPEPPYGTDDGVTLGRVSIEKVFSGGLEGAGRVEMLSARTATAGSAGYVAIERVTGTLNGREGSFVLQHSGTMNRGAPTLSVTVVPDSATGALVGLRGSMTIDRTESEHRYTFEYALGEA